MSSGFRACHRAQEIQVHTTLEGINWHRRRFLGATAATVAAAQLNLIGSAAAQAGGTSAARLPAVKPGANTSFGTPLSCSSRAIFRPVNVANSDGL